MAPFVGRQPELGGAARPAGRGASPGSPRSCRSRARPGSARPRWSSTSCRDRRRATPVVVRASGEETEALLAYGVVEQLARSAGAAGRRCSTGRARAGTVQDPVTVGTRILELLDRTGRPDRPVVLVVDDVHWADLPSVQALVFALRRLVADPVLALLAVRDDATRRAAGEPAPAGQRAPAAACCGCAGSTRRTCATWPRSWASTASGCRPRNGCASAPRATRCTPGRCSRSSRPRGGARSSSRCRRRGRSGLLVAGPLRRAAGPPPARLIDAAAVLGPHCPLPLAATLAEVERPLEAVDEAGRLRPAARCPRRSAPWTLSFPHPLVRAAVYDALGPARRHALHIAAARLVDRRGGRRCGTGSPRPRSPTSDWPPTSPGSPTPRRGRQAWQSAAAHLVEASRLSPDPEEAQRRVAARGGLDAAAR